MPGRSCRRAQLYELLLHCHDPFHKFEKLQNREEAHRQQTKNDANELQMLALNMMRKNLAFAGYEVNIDARRLQAGFYGGSGGASKGGGRGHSHNTFVEWLVDAERVPAIERATAAAQPA